MKEGSGGMVREFAELGGAQARQHRADKRSPPRAESGVGGLPSNFWQRPTFPHDVMQYHRRGRA